MSEETQERPVGRPRVMTSEKKIAVLAFLAAGGSRNGAAKYIGVSPTTIRAEAKRDSEFAHGLMRAEAACFMHHLANISRASASDWRASAWFLERKFPEEFSKNRRVKSTEDAVIVVRFVDDFFDRPNAIQAKSNEDDHE